MFNKKQIIDFFVPSNSNNFRPQVLQGRFFLYFLLFIFFLKFFVFLSLFGLPQTSFFAEISRAVLIDLTNKERQGIGVAPLRENAKLNQAAFLKAQDMLSKDYFGHQSPQGVSPWHWFDEAEYQYKTAGENLAIGFFDSESLYQAWKHSSTHKANLLNPAYQEVGVAVLSGSFKDGQATVVVQMFGSPKQSLIFTQAQAQTIIEKEKNDLLPTDPTEQKSAGSKEDFFTIEESDEVQEDLTDDSAIVRANQTKDDLAPKRGITERFLIFLIADFPFLLQWFLYILLGLAISILLLNVFIYFSQQHLDLILRAIFFIGLLLLLVLIDRKFFVSLLAYEMLIF